MKKTSIFFAIATIALLSACRKENFNATESTPGAVTVIGVGINDVKTTMGAPVEGTRKIYWANGDVLQANDLTSAALADLPEECTSARFTFDGTLTYPANLLYPADYYKDKDESTITLPLEQPVTPKVALYGYMDEEGDAQMNALLAYVHIPLTQGEDKDEIKTMTVESLTDGYCLGGDFTIDYETGALTPAAEASKKVSVLFNKPLNPEKATDFFAAVPAGENVKLSVKFKDVKGHYMTKTVTRTFAAGKVVSLPDTEFVPTATEFDVVITTAAQFVQFAKDYNDGKINDPLVQLGSDIVFDETTSAEFVATGGIGVEGGSNYFNGTLDGNGKSIKSFNNTADGVSVPLFAYTGSDGNILNLTLDASCTLSFPKGNAAPFVGRHKGLLENCVNNADVNLAMEAGVTYFGGLVGRLYGGTIKDCSMNGQLVNATTAGSTRTYNVGGISGTVEDGGIVTGCHMNNALVWGMKSKASGPQLSTGTLYLGLIAGNVIDGSIVDCDAIYDDAASDIRGNATGAIGGIAGILQKGTVSGCTCTQSNLYVRLSSGTYIHIGGIVGSNSGTVASCINNSTNFGGNGAEALETFGGICGINNAEGIIKDCRNTVKLAGPSQYDTIDTLYFGGIVGKNDGTVTVEKEEANVNSGEVDANSLKPKTVAFVGGIAGATSTNISNCSNSGAVTLGRGSDQTYKTLQCVAGGIGFVKSENELTITNVNNTGAVTYNANLKLNGRVNALGGIIGQIDAVKVTVSSCTNEGTLANNNFNNTYTLAGGAFLGGIVGVAVGVNGDNMMTITGCTNKIGTFNGQRGISGGIAGYTEYCNLADCTNTQNTGPISSNITTYTGGIVGWAKRTNITSCDAVCDMNQKSTAAGHDGGIVSKMENGTLIDGCTYQGTITIQNASGVLAAGIAGTATSAITIKNCGFKGKFSLDGGSNYTTFTSAEKADKQITSDANFTDGGGNHIID